MDKIYVVTADGYQAGYGSEIYLVGVFSTRDDVEKAINGYKESIFMITEVNLNKSYPLRKAGWKELVNDNYLGGYIE